MTDHTGRLKIPGVIPDHICTKSTPAGTEVRLAHSNGTTKVDVTSGKSGIEHVVITSGGLVGVYDLKQFG